VGAVIDAPERNCEEVLAQSIRRIHEAFASAVEVHDGDLRANKYFGRARRRRQRNEYRRAAAPAMRHALKLEAGVCINFLLTIVRLAPCPRRTCGVLPFTFPGRRSGTARAEGILTFRMRGKWHGVTGAKESQRARERREPGAQPNTRATSRLASKMRGGRSSGRSADGEMGSNKLSSNFCTMQL